jgi:hypothetical protein
MMRKVILAGLTAVVLAAAPSAALADQPPGQLGYEGQPGNQGGASGNPGGGGGGQPPGLLGYEGQPGNHGG